MSSKPTGREWEAAAAFLARTVLPLRLAVVDARGQPRIVSLWFEWDGTYVWCATQAHSQLARYVEGSSSCAFEVSTNDAPYRGARGRGDTELTDDGSSVLERLIERYDIAPESRFAQWLRSRAANEVAIRLRPVRMSHWDFTGRMTPTIGSSS
jgi:hypothetical protein